MFGLASGRRVFQAILFLGLFTLAVRNVDDPDVWWHLKTGEYIAAHKSVPRTDPFSSTRFGQPWVAHEWLTDLGLYELYRATGLAGPILLFAVMVTAALIVLYLRCGSAAYVAGAITLLGAFATRPVWGVRPQIISLLMTSFWLLILERSEKNPELLWWTVPLTLLWVNLHAGFALGLAVYAVFILGALIEAGFSHNLHSGLLHPAALVFGIDILIVPLNPNGLRMYSYPFETLRSSAMQNYIAEWASPNFHRAEYLPFLLLVLATFVALACSRASLRARDLLLLLASLFASLESIRLIPFFVLIAVPIISRRLPTWPRSDSHLRPAWPRTAINLAIILALAGFAAIHSQQVIGGQPAIEAEVFPARAVAFLKLHPPEGRIFNHYNWGGYLIWKLHPPIQVFIDGRADLYGEQFFHDFADAYQLKDDWQQILHRWQVETVIVPSDSALALGLQEDHDWSIEYHDAQATIFAISRMSR
ncbi:MAG TPA: hypothetical protein VGG14_11875 [Candidatus Sulfotelmatobacter sp.]|jgi:hypothetical protein